MSSDRIEKKVTLKAPQSRVWKALADASEFGRWFGVRFEGAFAVGKSMIGDWGDEGIPADRIEAIQKKLGLAPAPIKMPAKGTVFCVVEKMEPERLFSFRWVPFGIDAAVDPKSEPMTLVEFQLEGSGDTTHLTIIESGFDKVPAARRERAFRMNDNGWSSQSENLRRYVEGT